MLNFLFMVASYKILLFERGLRRRIFAVQCSKYLLLLAYRGVPLLIISILARQPFTKLIVLNLTRFSSRTNCLILLYFIQIALPTLLYHDLSIRE